VLDGAITILDGVKGVEAQTRKVWDHATKRGIPRLCFINKLDRIGSSIMRTAEAIQGLLKVDPLLFQMAVGQGENFRGVIDLVSMRETTFKGKYGEQLESVEVRKDHPLHAEAHKKRLELVEKIANYDDAVGDLFLNEQPISEGQLKAAVRRILNDPDLQSKVCPIFLGSAFRNKGVQLLMDAVVDYLPSPTERQPVASSLDPLLTRKPLKNERFSAYTFKVICDSELGPLAYTRIYSGELRKNSSFFNSSRGVVEKSNSPPTQSDRSSGSAPTSTPPSPRSPPGTSSPYPDSRKRVRGRR
jgi:elongation factor G